MRAMKTALPLSIISLAALVALPALAGPGRSGSRGAKVVDARNLRQNLDEAERIVDRLQRKLNRVCRRDCKGMRSELAQLERQLERMDRTLRNAPAATRPTHASHGPPAPISHRALSQLRSRMLHQDRNDHERVARLQRERPALTVHMTHAVLSTLSYASTKMQAVRVLAPYIVDPHNFALIDTAFRNRPYQDEARRLIASHQGRPRGGVYASNGTAGRGRRAP